MDSSVTKEDLIRTNTMSLREAAKELGVSHECVRLQCNKHNIKRDVTPQVVKNSNLTKQDVLNACTVSETNASAMEKLGINVRASFETVCDFYDVKTPVVLAKEKRELGLKKCSECGEWKALDEFWKDKSRKDGRQYICKPCFRPIAAENNRKWRAKEGAKKELSNVSN